MKCLGQDTDWRSECKGGSGRFGERVEGNFTQKEQQRKGRALGHSLEIQKIVRRPMRLNLSEGAGRKMSRGCAEVEHEDSICSCFIV